MPHLVRDRWSVFYERFPYAGVGAPAGTVLLVPGMSASTRALPTVVAGLQERYDVISLDPRGCGQTSPNRGAFTLRDIAQDALGVLDALSLSRVHVLGISMGGMITQELLTLAPHRFQSAVLSCTSLGPKAGKLPGTTGGIRIVSRLVRLPKQPSPEHVAATFGDILFAPDTPLPVRAAFFDNRRSHARVTPAGLVSQMLAVRRWDSPVDATRWTGPTLLLTGIEDRLVPSHNSDLLLRRLPHARAERLPGGHAYFFEHPARFNARVLSFYGEHDAHDHVARTAS